MIDSMITAMVAEIEIRNNKWENSTGLGEDSKVEDLRHDRSVLLHYIDSQRAEIARLSRIVDREYKTEHMLREALVHISKFEGSNAMFRELAEYYLERDGDCRRELQ